SWRLARNSCARWSRRRLPRAEGPEKHNRPIGGNGYADLAFSRCRVSDRRSNDSLCAGKKRSADGQISRLVLAGAGASRYLAPPGPGQFRIPEWCRHSALLAFARLRPRTWWLRRPRRPGAGAVAPDHGVHLLVS